MILRSLRKALACDIIQEAQEKERERIASFIAKHANYRVHDGADAKGQLKYVAGLIEDNDMNWKEVRL